MDFWPNKTSFRSEEIVEISRALQVVFTQESSPEIHAYFSQLIIDNS